MEKKNDAYDIIIIGAGTAGCVLANRLSDDASLSILVLEAGENHNEDERVYTPGLSHRLIGNDDVDWNYVSEPQSGLNGRTMKHPRGKIVGDSSAINSFALIYPSKAGMDAWANLTGDETWGWNGMEKYFRKFQTIVPPDEEVMRELRIVQSADTNRETKGPIEASFPLTPDRFKKDWVQTFRNLGLENRSEPLDGEALGGYISACHITSKHERSHARMAYLEPVKGRENLHIVTGALVQRIIFDRPKADGDAEGTGVQYTHNNTANIAALNPGGEIILAAGAFASPQLLEISGIGNPNLLRRYNIPVVHANPAVGENLQDHIRPGLSFETIDEIEGRDPIPASEAREMYERNRSGPWGERACFSFAHLPLVPFLEEEERIELTNVLDRHLSSNKGDGATDFEKKRHAFIRTMIESPTEGTATAFLSSKPAIPDPDGRNFITLFAMLSHPFSTGSAHISSTDPATQPMIDSGYYTHPLDIYVHALHLRTLETIARTAPLSSALKPHGRRLPLGMDALTLERGGELIRGHAMTNHHPCGSCSMLPEDNNGVVSNRLKVYGTSNIRVVDASVIPIIPRGNILTTVYAVAERAADIVREDLSKGTPA